MEMGDVSHYFTVAGLPYKESAFEMVSYITAYLRAHGLKPEMWHLYVLWDEGKIPPPVSPADIAQHKT